MNTLAERFETRLTKRRREVTAALDGEIARLGLLREKVAALDAEVLLAAIDAFGSLRESVLWLASPEARFADRSPVEVSGAAEGKEKVIGILLGRVGG